MTISFEKMEDGKPAAAEPLWRQYRSQFPVTENLLYLNHAAIGPLCRPAAEAMQRFTDDALRFGSLHYDHWLAAYESLRVAAAKLIHAHRDEIAIVKNTSEGVSTVALGLDWRPGDTIVAFEDEFPANQYP
ncbi:MAG: aminotransferase class V-fold PLP-dependent enzyme, partial [Bryobacteraceae bacterium]